MANAAALHPLTIQLLDWLDSRPRTYTETMNAWRTSCPRLSIWEDALAAHLIAVGPASAGAGYGTSPVTLTGEGRDVLARSG
jgi:hypothetical protein